MQNARRQAAAGAVILLVCCLLVWMVTYASAVEITLRATDAPTAAKIYWSIIEPTSASLIVRSDGREASVEIADQPIKIEREMFLIDWEQRTFERRKQRWIISTADVLPGPDPGPFPPGPNPVKPDGFEAEVTRAAKMLQDDAAALAFAQNFATVASEVAAGSLTKLDDVAARIRELNEAVATKTSWREFGAAMAAKLRQQKTLADIRAVLQQISRGLYAVGGTA